MCLGKRKEEEEGSELRWVVLNTPLHMYKNPTLLLLVSLEDGELSKGGSVLNKTFRKQLFIKCIDLAIKQY